MATALHPQTILATKYAGEVIAGPFGCPLRLHASTKLGYKNAKWIKAIEVTNDFRETFWSAQGENWFAGIRFTVSAAAKQSPDGGDAIAEREPASSRKHRA
jgi:DMSO/TMAO reductase YedYZ molybdopterin-dependent catalytic subunit